MTTRPADPTPRRWLIRLALACGALPGLIASQGDRHVLSAQSDPDQEPVPVDTAGTIRRVLLEAEHFVGAGWRPIAVGEGNYMIDVIGASHVSGGRLLHADAEAIGATARADLRVPG